MSENLPELARVVQLPDGTYTYADPRSLPAIPQQSGPQVVHIHQAAPDRTFSASRSARAWASAGSPLGCTSGRSSSVC
jgi:hypothetical protein